MWKGDRSLYLFGELGISKQNGILCSDNFIFLIGKNALTLRPSFICFHLLPFSWFISSQHSISEMPAFALCFLALYLSKLNLDGCQQGNAMLL